MTELKKRYVHQKHEKIIYRGLTILVKANGFRWNMANYKTLGEAQRQIDIVVPESKN